ncbi:MAG: SDR family oxidoreductase [Hyphomicrobiaceae bacterium]|nr:SDR family oxidoreductase [Hyphomicrobiaceae bacterium]
MASGATALVTGANRGIGLEVVRQLATAGVRVALGARSIDKGRAAAARLSAAGLDVVAVALDVTSSEQVSSAVAEVANRFGRLDILVNNAGIMIDGTSGGDGTAASLREDVLARTFDVNTYGALRVSQAVAPIMRARRYGRIVNVSSGLSQLSRMGGGYAAYRMSKVALNAMTRVLAAELAPSGIKVNVMSPGWVRTDMGGAGAPRSVAEGADTIVWLATLPEDGPNGGFFEDRKPMDW